MMATAGMAMIAEQPALSAIGNVARSDVGANRKALKGAIDSSEIETEKAAISSRNTTSTSKKAGDRNQSRRSIIRILVFASTAARGRCLQFKVIAAFYIKVWQLQSNR